MPGQLIGAEGRQAEFAHGLAALLGIEIGEVARRHAAFGRVENQGKRGGHNEPLSIRAATPVFLAECGVHRRPERDDRAMTERPADLPEPPPDLPVRGQLEPQGATKATPESNVRPAPEIPLDRSRAASTWTGLVIGVLVLILLLVFILQNLDPVTMEMFVWEFTLPLGVSLLLSAIAGALVMALAGGVRILQIKRAAKRR